MPTLAETERLIRDRAMREDIPAGRVLDLLNQARVTAQQRVAETPEITLVAVQHRTGSAKNLLADVDRLLPSLLACVPPEQHSQYVREHVLNTIWTVETLLHDLSQRVRAGLYQAHNR